MEKVMVDLKDRSYDIFIQKNLLNTLGEEIRKIYKGRKIVVITDTNVHTLYANKLLLTLKNSNYETSEIIIDAGESSKSIETLQYVYEKLYESQIDRNGLIIAFGGGVVGDLAGFAASTFLRGIPFVQVPTTLLSQVDSSVGGKTAINFNNSKNIIGSFYQPKAVFIDSTVLKTLDNKYIKDGLGEVIKYGCIKSDSLFNKLLSFKDIEELLYNIDDIIYECVTIKSDIVTQDEKDTGIRNILNFGHTLGHGIESLYNYETYSHGEAVAIGMYYMTKISESVGLTKESTANKIKQILQHYDIPYEVDINNIDAIINIIKHDKKINNGIINLVMIKEIGEAFIHKESIEFLKNNLIS